MAWAAVAGAAVGAVASGALSGGKSSGGTTTQSKDPWSDAVPWLQSNINQGMGLQNYYQANPFNPIQQGAYSNLLEGNNYINNMLPGLLAQMSSGGGFDRNNPTAKPQAFQFPAYSMAGYTPVTGGLLNQSLTRAVAPTGGWGTLGVPAQTAAPAAAAPILPGSQPSGYPYPSDNGYPGG